MTQVTSPVELWKTALKSTLAPLFYVPDQAYLCPRKARAIGNVDKTICECERRVFGYHASFEV